MNTDALVPAGILLGAFLVGLRSTVRIFRLYRAIAPVLLPLRRLIAWAFVVVCVLIIVAVGWLAFVQVRRLLGFEPFELSALISYVLTIPVLLIPLFLERVLWRIGQGAALEPGVLAEIRRRLGRTTP